MFSIQPQRPVEDSALAQGLPQAYGLNSCDLTPGPTCSPLHITQNREVEHRKDRELSRTQTRLDVVSHHDGDLRVRSETSSVPKS